MSKTVGIVGLGIMGSAISPNLVERGWHVIGFDIDPVRCAELAQAGVTIAGDVGEVARDAPIIMTSLPTPAAVSELLTTSIVQAANPGKSPTTTATRCRLGVTSKAWAAMITPIQRMMAMPASALAFLLTKSCSA